MPIYEFYCPRCHRIFSFFSSGVNTAAQPACPRCGRERLGRRPSTFSVGTSGRGEGDSGEDLGSLAGMDEARLERAMESVLGGMDPASEDDPRQMARLLRRFGEASGLEPGPRMEELLRRMEAGEDPDVLEAELEGSTEAEGEEGVEGIEDFFRLKSQLDRSRRSKRAAVDPELYFL